MAHHEIWLDEAHHFLLARDSHSVSELFFNARYEGHPLIWNLILFAITRLSPEPVWMQVVHSVIVISAAVVLVIYAPFYRIEKVLVLSGYYFLFEYNLLSRNYSLMLLALFAGIVLINRKRYIAAAIALVILANVHLFGVFVGLSTILLLATEMLRQQRSPLSREVVVGLCILTTGMALSLWQVIPPMDSSAYEQGSQSSAMDRLLRMSAVFMKAFIPIPEMMNHHFWNSNILMSISKPFSAGLSIILFIVPAFTLRRHLQVFAFFYAGIAMLFVFLFATNLNVVRHFGFVFVLYLASEWLTRTQPEIQVPKFGQVTTRRMKRIFFTLVLIAQAIAGISSYVLDLIKPFSESKRMAAYLAGRNFREQLVAGGCGVGPVAAYLQEPIYSLSDAKAVSYCHFNRSVPLRRIDSDYLITASITHARQHQRTIILISNEPLDASDARSGRFMLLNSFTKSVVRNENYFAYRLVADSAAIALNPFAEGNVRAIP